MESQRSVLIVGNFLSEHSRSRGVCEDLAEHLMTAGWKVTTTSNKLGRIARIFDMLKTVWSQRNHYELATIDAFSGLSFLWAEMIGFVLSILGKPSVITLHGGNLPSFAQRWPGRVTRLLKSAAVVTTPSRYLMEQMKVYCPDLMLVPNPIEVPNYRFELRRDPRPILVWLRTFEDIYNAPLAIYLAASLIPSYPHFRLFMGGGDNGNGSLQTVKQLAADLGISSFVEFAGRINNANVPNWLQSGDIFINTTNVDNTPVSVLEAMACGLCVISTNIGGIPYLLDDEKDAILVPPNNPEAMAAAVRRILVEPELAERLSRNARQKAEQFDWSVILPQWEKLLREVAGIM